MFQSVPPSQAPLDDVVLCAASLAHSRVCTNTCAFFSESWSQPGLLDRLQAVSLRAFIVTVQQQLVSCRWYRAVPSVVARADTLG